MSNVHEEEALGKAYDSRLIRRLMQYMRPYKWRVVLALSLVAIVTPLELSPPIIFGWTIDRYFSPVLNGSLPESAAWRGVILISVIYLLVLIFDFLAQYIQIRIMQGRTTILISHRTSTVRDADQIVVLVEGAIAECGTHDELLARGGYYADLYQKQLLEEELERA